MLHSLKELRASLGSVVREAMANPDEEHPVAAIVPLGELRRLRAQARLAELRRRSAAPLDEAATATWVARARSPV